MTADAYIEALLFYRSSAVKKNAVKKLLAIDDSTLELAVTALQERLQGGIRLIETDTELQLVTAPELGEFFEALQKEELKKDIGKAGAETLAIILYRAPVSRAEIDHIRGVNSSSILRALLTRGLINRVSAPKGTGYSFEPSTDLLAHLGVTRKEELPQYSDILTQLEQFEAATNEESSI